MPPPRPPPAHRPHTHPTTTTTLTLTLTLTRARARIITASVLRSRHMVWRPLLRLWIPGCRSRAANLVALFAFGVICHAQMGRPDATDVKSCDTEFAICQALLSAVRAKGVKDIARLAAITPSSKSNGARSHSPAAV
jgi:hypothetical protein